MDLPASLDAVLAGLGAHRHLDREKALLAIEEGLKPGAARAALHLAHAACCPLQHAAVRQALLQRVLPRSQAPAGSKRTAAVPAPDRSRALAAPPPQARPRRSTPACCAAASRRCCSAPSGRASSAASWRQRCERRFCRGAPPQARRHRVTGSCQQARQQRAAAAAPAAAFPPTPWGLAAGGWRCRPPYPRRPPCLLHPAAGREGARAAGRL